MSIRRVPAVTVLERAHEGAAAATNQVEDFYVRTALFT